MSTCTSLETLGARPVAVRRPSELASVDGLVLPGGESTTMAKLARIFELLEPLRDRIAEGLPVFGTCAGMILLADRIEDGVVGQETLGGLDITVRRNAFGRQVDSFEGDAGLRRARPSRCTPSSSARRGSRRSGTASRCSPACPTAAGAAAGRIVAVRQGPLMATSFHPEVGRRRPGPPDVRRPRDGTS